MIFIKKQYKLFLIIISLILLVSLFKLIHYLSINKYIVECFEKMNTTKNTDTSNKDVSNKNITDNTNHTVNLPLNTSYSCKNFCGPTARCSITGQQCLADIDCPGCQPYVPPTNSKKIDSENIEGNDDAGKLTVGTTPTYSVLTTDIGTKANLFPDKKFAKAPSADFGINIWRKDFNEDEKMFDKRYKPKNLEYMPTYPQRYSLTGEFMEEGPLASNAVLN